MVVQETNSLTSVHPQVSLTVFQQPSMESTVDVTTAFPDDKASRLEECPDGHQTFRVTTHLAHDDNSVSKARPQTIGHSTVYIPMYISPTSGVSPATNLHKSAGAHIYKHHLWPPPGTSAAITNYRSGRFACLPEATTERW